MKLLLNFAGVSISRGAVGTKPVRETGHSTRYQMGILDNLADIQLARDILELGWTPPGQEFRLNILLVATMTEDDGLQRFRRLKILPHLSTPTILMHLGRSVRIRTSFRHYLARALIFEASNI